jgi:polyhydroxyalkanoate synthase
LALLATPWDFSADAPPMVAMLPMMAPSMMAVVDTLGEMPTDMIQSMFYGLDPMLVATKFLRFAALDPAGDAAREFVALEDWLNDGVALAGPVAREALLGWYAESTPARLRWRIAGRTVDPSRVATPSLALIPSRDRIVPPASAEALSRALPNARALTTPLGHIGMAVSARARDRAWEPLAEWMESLE